MSFSLSSVTPDTIFEDGGYLLEITGTFILDHEYYVHVGSNSSTADPKCYSGKPEYGFSIYPISVTKLKCFSPVIVPGGTYAITVVDQGTAGEHQLIMALTVTDRNFYNSVYDLRNLLPRFYRTGQRSMETEV